MSTLLSAAEEGRSRSTAARVVGSLDNGKQYLFPTPSVVTLLQVTRNTLFYLIRKSGVRPVGGRGRPADPYLWDSAAVNRLSETKKGLKTYKEPRGMWEKDAISVEAVEK